MKKYIVFFAAIVLVGGCVSCTDKPTPGNNITEPGLVDSTFYYCAYPDKCAITYRIRYKDISVGDHWYWASIHSLSASMVGGKVFAYSTGNNFMEINATYNYFDTTSLKYYDKITVYRCETEAGVGDEENSSSGSASIVVQPQHFTSSTCDQYCCTGPEMSKDRWYASAIKHVNGLLGLRCDMADWSTVHMCGYSLWSRDSALSAVHLNVGCSPENYWAQVGIAAVRPEGEYYTEKWVFFEVVGPQRQVLLFELPDALPHTYLLELIPYNGTWNFSIDNSLIPTGAITSDGWIEKTGTYFSFNGEVMTRETDMMGRADDRYTFENCMFHQEATAWQNAAFLPAECGVSDRFEWGVDDTLSSGNTVRVWDWKPLQ